ncbi:regulator [Pantoea agglomerans]|uniref:transcriptional antitermination N peptide n=1 Tax=Pantoea TaxID=53335 RepID=UPI001F283717|nr:MULTISPECIES: regulator [Pantoea]UIL53973.1 regulator [Pantoea agglomerans]
MTVITYGTSVKENAKSRRHARRRAVAMDRERIESIIDTAFGIEPEVVAIQVKHISRIEKACISPSLRDRHESTSVCLPDVAIYNAGHRTVRKGATHIYK